MFLKFLNGFHLEISKNKVGIKKFVKLPILDYETNQMLVFQINLFKFGVYFLILMKNLKNNGNSVKNERSKKQKPGLVKMLLVFAFLR